MDDKLSGILGFHRWPALHLSSCMNNRHLACPCFSSPSAVSSASLLSIFSQHSQLLLSAHNQSISGSVNQSFNQSVSLISQLLMTVHKENNFHSTVKYQAISGAICRVRSPFDPWNRGCQTYNRKQSHKAHYHSSTCLSLNLTSQSLFFVYFHSENQWEKTK